jgi:hypothetical protein
MSAMAMKPTFTDREGYLQWRREWKIVYKRISQEVREGKREAASAASRGDVEQAAAIQRDLVYNRVMASKMMMLMGEAKARRDRILEMHRQLAEQNAQFPLVLDDCRIIDFHFNKGSLEFPFLPMWTLKTKGRSYYINHIDSTIPWSTRELPEGSTRGMIRLRNADIEIDAEGNATLTPARAKLKAVA